MPVITPHVPEGLIDLMKALAKSVLKEKPENIYEFAAVHFENLLLERDGNLDKGYEKFKSSEKYIEAREKCLFSQIKNYQQEKKRPEPLSIPTQDEVENVDPEILSPHSLQNKFKPRKLSSRKTSEILLAIKEEDEQVAGTDEVNILNQRQESAAFKIQKAFRNYINRKVAQKDFNTKLGGLSEDAAAIIIQRTLRKLFSKTNRINVSHQKVSDEGNLNGSPLSGVLETDHKNENSSIEPSFNLNMEKRSEVVEQTNDTLKEMEESTNSEEANVGHEKYYNTNVDNNHLNTQQVNSIPENTVEEQIAEDNDDDNADISEAETVVLTDSLVEKTNALEHETVHNAGSSEAIGKLSLDTRDTNLGDKAIDSMQLEPTVVDPDSKATKLEKMYNEDTNLDTKSGGTTQVGLNKSQSRSDVKTQEDVQNVLTEKQLIETGMVDSQPLNSKQVHKENQENQRDDVVSKVDKEISPSNLKSSNINQQDGASKDVSLKNQDVVLGKSEFEEQTKSLLNEHEHNNSVASDTERQTYITNEIENFNSSSTADTILADPFSGEAAKKDHMEDVSKENLELEANPGNNDLNSDKVVAEIEQSIEKMENEFNGKGGILSKNMDDKSGMVKAAANINTFDETLKDISESRIEKGENQEESMQANGSSINNAGGEQEPNHSNVSDEIAKLNTITDVAHLTEDNSREELEFPKDDKSGNSEGNHLPRNKVLTNIEEMHKIKVGQLNSDKMEDIQKVALNYHESGSEISTDNQKDEGSDHVESMDDAKKSVWYVGPDPIIPTIKEHIKSNENSEEQVLNTKKDEVTEGASEVSGLVTVEKSPDLDKGNKVGQSVDPNENKNFTESHEIKSSDINKGNDEDRSLRALPISDNHIIIDSETNPSNPTHAGKEETKYVPGNLDETEGIGNLKNFGILNQMNLLNHTELSESKQDESYKDDNLDRANQLHQNDINSGKSEEETKTDKVENERELLYSNKINGKEWDNHQSSTANEDILQNIQNNSSVEVSSKNLENVDKNREREEEIDPDKNRLTSSEIHDGKHQDNDLEKNMQGIRDNPKESEISDSRDFRNPKNTKDHEETKKISRNFNESFTSEDDSKAENQLEVKEYVQKLEVRPIEEMLEVGKSDNGLKKSGSNKEGDSQDGGSTENKEVNFINPETEIIASPSEEELTKFEPNKRDREGQNDSKEYKTMRDSEQDGKPELENPNQQIGSGSGGSPKTAEASVKNSPTDEQTGTLPNIANEIQRVSENKVISGENSQIGPEGTSELEKNTNEQEKNKPIAVLSTNAEVFQNNENGSIDSHDPKPKDDNESGKSDTKENQSKKIIGSEHQKTSDEVHDVQHGNNYEEDKREENHAAELEISGPKGDAISENKKPANSNNEGPEQIKSSDSRQDNEISSKPNSPTRVISEKSGTDSNEFQEEKDSTNNNLTPLRKTNQNTSEEGNLQEKGNSKNEEGQLLETHPNEKKSAPNELEINSKQEEHLTDDPASHLENKNGENFESVSKIKQNSTNLNQTKSVEADTEHTNDLDKRDDVLSIEGFIQDSGNEDNKEGHVILEPKEREKINTEANNKNNGENKNQDSQEKGESQSEGAPTPDERLGAINEGNADEKVTNAEKGIPSKDLAVISFDETSKSDSNFIDLKNESNKENHTSKQMESKMCDLNDSEVSTQQGTETSNENLKENEEFRYQKDVPNSQEDTLQNDAERNLNVHPLPEYTSVDNEISKSDVDINQERTTLERSDPMEVLNSENQNILNDKPEEDSRVVKNKSANLLKDEIKGLRQTLSNASGEELLKDYPANEVKNQLDQNENSSNVELPHTINAHSPEKADLALTQVAYSAPKNGTNIMGHAYPDNSVDESLKDHSQLENQASEHETDVNKEGTTETIVLLNDSNNERQMNSEESENETIHPIRSDVENSTGPQGESLQISDLAHNNPALNSHFDSFVDKDRQLTEYEESANTQKAIGENLHNFEATETSHTDLSKESKSDTTGSPNTIENEPKALLEEKEEVIEEPFTEKRYSHLTGSRILSTDLSDADTTRAESRSTINDELSEIENIDISTYGEDSLEAMYYSLRKNEIMLDRMQKQASERKSASRDREPLKKFDEQSFRQVKSMDELQRSFSTNSEDDVVIKRMDKSGTAKPAVIFTNENFGNPIAIVSKTTEKLLENMHKFNPNPRRIDIDSDSEDEKNKRKPLRDYSPSIRMKSRVPTPVREHPKSVSFESPIELVNKQSQLFMERMHGEYQSSENLDKILGKDGTTETIQQKMLAYSISETDSDYCEVPEERTNAIHDDFNISTALETASTDTDSTTVSAATKIQAGARGFLTRRRLRRASVGAIPLESDSKASFGNEAIGESLEDLIEQNAAAKIQKSYRQYRHRKIRKSDPDIRTLSNVSSSSKNGSDEGKVIGITQVKLEQKSNLAPGGTSSDDSCTVTDRNNTLNDANSMTADVSSERSSTDDGYQGLNLAARRLTLQRGDAVQMYSTPDDENGDQASGQPNTETSSEKRKPANSDTWRHFVLRQRSMPVQIDSEIFRIIPKHMRKRIRSADIHKQKRNDMQY